MVYNIGYALNTQNALVIIYIFTTFVLTHACSHHKILKTKTLKHYDNEFIKIIFIKLPEL